MKQGDFTTLAKSYIHRVGYSDLVLEAIYKYAEFEKNIVIADIAAGTGKLTENLSKYPHKEILCVEPNDSMMIEGKKYLSDDQTVFWVKGSGEETTLKQKSIDWVTVGSAFHWMNTELALNEFYRILKSGGLFTAIWNPRNVIHNEFHEKIEKSIYEIAPLIERKSSGSGKFTEDLDEKIKSTGQFRDVIYIEAKHEEIMSKERYLGIWRSVNDIPAQTGPEAWEKIMSRIESIIAPYKEIIVPYKTRSWTARVIK